MVSAVSYRQLRPIDHSPTLSRPCVIVLMEYLLALIFYFVYINILYLYSKWKDFNPMTLREETAAVRRPGDRLASDALYIRQSEFSELGEITYLDVASRAPLSQSVRQSAADFLEMRSRGGNKDKMFDIIDRIRPKVASLIGATAHDIAFTKNTSEGLNIIASSMGLGPGDEVVLCPDVEHPNNVYPWLHLRDQIGISLKFVAPQNGCTNSEAIADAISEKTRIVTVSAVTFAPGTRTNLRLIGERAHEAGAFFLVDGAQAVGVCNLDVERDCIDGLAFSTQKGLLGLYGLGFLYCRESWANRMTPVSVARFSVDINGHEADFGEHYQLKRGAHRFEVGNYNYLAAAALESSLDLLLSYKTPEIDAYLGTLSSILIEELTARDLPIVGGKRTEMCHIVTAGIQTKSNGEASDSTYARLERKLKEAGIVISSRRGLLRFSFHLFNTPQDIMRVLEVLDKELSH